MIKQKNNSWVYCIYVIILAYFLSQLAPAIFWKDSGDLVTSSFFVSTAPPTGYPLYVISGKLFSNLPFGCIAFRLNIFSAVCAALTILVFGQFIYEIFKSRWIVFTTI